MKASDGVIRNVQYGNFELSKNVLRLSQLYFEMCLTYRYLCAGGFLCFCSILWRFSHDISTLDARGFLKAGFH